MAFGFNSLGFGFSGRSVSTPLVLRYATVQNRPATGEDSQASMDRFGFRWPHRFGGSTKKIKFGLSGWYLAGNLGEQVTTNSYTILSMYAECNGVAVQCKWSGVGTKTIASDDPFTFTDFLSASDFGLSEFTNDTQIWIKGYGSVPSAGDKIPYMQTETGDVANSQAFWYADSATTIGNTTGTGVYTFTGVPETTKINGMRPICIGLKDPKEVVFLGVGDSIGAGQADGTENGEYGKGFIHRAMVSAKNTGDHFACGNLAESGIEAQDFKDGTRWDSQLAPYATHAIDNLGTNDLTSTADSTKRSTLETNIQLVWAKLAASGIEKIYRMELLPRTSSTDSWATAANQTVNTGWGLASEVGTFHSFLDGKVGDGITAVVSSDRVRDIENPDKWDTDGSTTFFVSADGTHMKSRGHELQAESLKFKIREDLYAFNVSYLPGYFVHYADDYTLSGSEITTINDESGNGYHTNTQATSTKRAIQGIDGSNGYATFDGIDDFYQLPNAAFNSFPARGNDGNTVIAVWKPYDTSRNNYLVDSYITAGSRFGLRNTQSGPYNTFFNNGTGFNFVNHSFTPATTNLQIIGGRRLKTHQKSFIPSGETSATNAANGTVTHGTFLCAYLGTSNFAKGDLYAIIFFNKYLLDDEKTYLINGLKTQYGIA